MYFKESRVVFSGRKREVGENFHQFNTQTIKGKPSLKISVSIVYPDGDLIRSAKMSMLSKTCVKPEKEKTKILEYWWR